MDTNETNLPASQIAEAIERLLAEGVVAVLVTLVEASVNIGAKLLVEEAGATTGTLGDEGLDRAVIEFAGRFLDSSDEAHTFRIVEFAPQLTDWVEAKILCERIEPEPRSLGAQLNPA